VINKASQWVKVIVSMPDSRSQLCLCLGALPLPQPQPVCLAAPLLLSQGTQPLAPHRALAIYTNSTQTNCNNQKTLNSKTPTDQYFANTTCPRAKYLHRKLDVSSDISTHLAVTYSRYCWEHVELRQHRVWFMCNNTGTYITLHRLGGTTVINTHVKEICQLSSWQRCMVQFPFIDCTCEFSMQSIICADLGLEPAFTWYCRAARVSMLLWKHDKGNG